MTTTLYWHDYETFGTDPQCDRAAQFAGIRTDEDLNIIGEPLNIYCKLPADYLPHPEACLTHGITPQLVQEKGLIEPDFIEQIHQELSQPNTCGVGYNSVKFDDAFTRNLLYRNLRDPYRREYQNGNSRWDLMNVMRLTSALRPDDIEWPEDNGVPNYRLETLTKVNGLAHENAHDALSDVQGLIALARLLKEHKPKLYNYAFANRGKHQVKDQLALGSWQPVVQAGSYTPNKWFGTTMVLPVAEHPTDKNSVIAIDLRGDPERLMELPVDELKALLYTPKEELGEGVERLPLREIRINTVPILAPYKTLNEEAAARVELDLAVCAERVEQLRAWPGLSGKMTEIYKGSSRESPQDVDQMIYSKFFNETDRAVMNELVKLSPEELANVDIGRDRDDRLPEMFFRYRARNWPETLNDEEASYWSGYCEKRLGTEPLGQNLTREALTAKIQGLRGQVGLSEEKLLVLDALDSYIDQAFG